MKKIMLSVMAVIGLTAASQAQFRVGVKAGGMLDDQRTNVKGTTGFGSKALKGYQAGIIADVRLGGNFYLQPQVLYSRKSSMHLKTTENVRLKGSYVEVPVNVVYKLDVGFGKAFAGAGGAFSYGFNGSEETGGVKTKMYKGPQSNWKREDVSLTFTAGVEFNNGLFASINTQHGLLDVYKPQAVNVRNRSLSLSVGYFIDWKKFGRKA